MLNVILTIHMIACLALVVAIMLQRSEGGALGMSGGGTGGLISGRGAAGIMVRVTMGLAAVFFVTSITMTFLNNQANTAPGVLERQIQQDGSGNPLGTGLTGSGTTTVPAPAAPAPAAPAPTIDPLAPATTTPAATPPANGAATPPASAPATTPAAPATTTPAPAPVTPPAENGGSNN